MIELPLNATGQAVLALAILGVMFIAFLRERQPVEVVALAGAAAMLFLGLLPYHRALEMLANPAPWTIAAMFVVMGAMVRTGALEWITRRAEAWATRHRRGALAAMLGLVVVASAFMNNTPVVVVMIPVFLHLSASLRIPPSRLMLPLSYSAILGGTLTLIGTSTNLLVDGIARAHGLAPFGIFEITPVGLVAVAWGMLYLLLFGPRLLPDRTSMAGILSHRRRMKFFTEVVIPEGSPLIGRKVTEVPAFRGEGMRIIDVLRGDASLRRELDQVVLQPGDRVVLRTNVADVLALRDNRALSAAEKVSSVETTTVEALITPGCRMVGRRLGSLRLRRRYGVYPLALHRRNQNIGSQLDDVIVRVGDTLLLEGAPEDLQRLAADMDLVNLSLPSERPFRRHRAPIALAAMAAVVLVAALGIAPIFVAAVVAVAVVLVTGCIDAEEAFGFIDGRLLALILAMLAVGGGLEHTGAVRMVAGWLAPALEGLPPFLVVWAVYLLTSVLTELVTNNAVAVVMTPVAISIAEGLGVDARPLVVAVMVAASAAFATPVGYQTNTLVFAPGGYRFTDFLRIGIPLNLSLGLVTSFVIPLLWPL